MQTDRVLDSIQYCNWHLMPIASQHAIQLMILRAQHPPKLMSGNVELNFNLFVNVRRFGFICHSFRIINCFTFADNEEYLFVYYGHG